MRPSRAAMSELRRSSRAASAASKSGVRLSALSLGALLSSCLVTNKVDYDQPIIVSRLNRETPATEFSPLPVEPDEWCEREGKGYMLFEVAVSDLNREEELTLRYVANKVVVNSEIIPPTGEEGRGIIRFCIPQTDLDEACNLVEAVVASRFSFGDRRPYEARDGDVAIAHWWVIGNAEDNPSAAFFDCPDARPDAGVP